MCTQIPCFHQPTVKNVTWWGQSRGLSASLWPVYLVEIWLSKMPWLLTFLCCYYEVSLQHPAGRRHVGHHDPAHSHGCSHFTIAEVLLFEVLLETGALTSKGQFILEATMSDPDQEYRLRSARIPCSNVESVYKAFFKQQNKVVYKGTFQIRWREH